MSFKFFKPNGSSRVGQNRYIKKISILCFILLTFIAVLSPIRSTCKVQHKTTFPEVPLQAGQDAISRAYNFMADKFDQYNSRFYVYEDEASAGNHFTIYTAFQNDSHSIIDSNCRSSPQSGLTCIKCTFDAWISWDGFSMQNGVLLNGSNLPQANWGTYPNAGYNLTGSTEIKFWARGETGGETLSFFAFGLGVGVPSPPPFPDSWPQVSITVTLTAIWQQYIISLPSFGNLSYIQQGFGWTATNYANPQNITFYLDEIYYAKNCSYEPHFGVSYTLLPSDNLDGINTAYAYDNALAILAFLANPTIENINRATMIGEAFVYAKEHDRFFMDGRLRDGYTGGMLSLPPGWIINEHANTVRIPYWPTSSGIKEDISSIGTNVGNMAWVALALLTLYERTGNVIYLNSTIDLASWVNNTCYDIRGFGGYTAGYAGLEPSQTKLMYKSVEHNLDLFPVFTRLSMLTGNSSWLDCANWALTFIQSMWNSGGNFFYTATTDDGITPNATIVPLDINALSILATNLTTLYAPALTWIVNNLDVLDGFAGFSFSTADTRYVWVEGTAQTIVAFQTLGDNFNATYFTRQLEIAQKSGLNADGYGLIASSQDGLQTGFGTVYNARLHWGGATAWFLFAELKNINPFWNFQGYDPFVPKIISVSPNPYICYAGEPSNMLQWNITDDIVNEPTYSIYLNSTLQINSSWDSGVLVNYTIGIAFINEPGYLNVTIVANNGYNSISQYEVHVIVNDIPTINSSPNIVCRVGVNNRSIWWKMVDTISGMTSYTIYRNETYAINGTWISGANISIIVDDLPVGYFNFTCVVNDGLSDNISSTVFVTVYQLTTTSSSPITYEKGATNNTITWIISCITDAIYGNYTILRNGTFWMGGNWRGYAQISINVDGLNEGLYIFTLIAFSEAGDMVKESIVVSVTSKPLNQPTPPDNFAIVILILMTGMFISLIFILIKKRSFWTKKAMEIRRGRVTRNYNNQVKT